MMKLLKRIKIKIEGVIKKRNIKKYGAVGENAIIPKSMKNISRSNNIFLGDFVSIGKDVVMYATEQSRIVIGNGSIIAPRCKIITSNHNYNSNDLKSIPFDNRNYVKDIIIEEAVWIGDSVIILPGVTICKGAVIGSGSVVTKDVPPYAIAVGNPAKVVKHRDKEVFEKLLKEERFYRAVDWSTNGGKSFINIE